MKRAKVYLNSGEMADIKLMFSNIENWIDDITTRGITTATGYFPYHSINYIIFEDVDKDDDDEIEVELEPSDNEPDVVTTNGRE